MNYPNSVIPDYAVSALKLKNAVVHRFQDKIKTKIAEGPCELFETNINGTPEPDAYLMKVDAFIEQIRGTAIFVRINYPENSTFLFEKQVMPLYSVSFHKDTQGLDKLEEILAKHAVVLDFNSQNINSELASKIKTQCPDNIQTKDITADAKSLFKKIGKALGFAAGKINSATQGPTREAAAVFSERASKIGRESFSEETKQKWQGLKNTSERVNQTLSNTIRPVLFAYNRFVDTVGQLFYSSENTVVKTVRQYSLAFSEAANEAEHQVGNHEVSQLKETPMEGTTAEFK